MTVSKLICRFRIAIIVVFSTSTISGFGKVAEENLSTGETNPEYIHPGTYLVVGAFAIEENAENFSNYITKQGISSQYAYYPVTGYYYVYTYTDSEKEAVVAAYHQLRENTEFADAWVFVAQGPAAAEENHETEIINPIETQSTQTELRQMNPDALTENNALVTPKKVSASEVADLNQQSVLFVKFAAHRNNTNKPIKATIKIVDGIRSKNIAEASTQETVGLDKTKIMDSVLQIIPYAIGFRKEQFDLPIYFDEENNDSYLLGREGDTLTMELPLHRLKKGDIQVMFNTYFHSNSSVMRVRSRYELDQLVDMLNENPSMKIKLHGHTNGAGRGFTYLFKPEEGNFFDLRQGKEYKKNGVGSVKLSALRAETIKSYLENKGIAADRIETQGWGGKRMLYPPDSPLAKNNIRVEIEVLSE
jgi:outer membrane protein OmpA-like peptidoglycan-associated protein